jgi:hypothetical protein
MMYKIANEDGGEPRWMDTKAEEQAVSIVIEGPLISK